MYLNFDVILCTIVLLLPCCLQRPLDAKAVLFNYGFLNTTDASSEMLTDATKKFQKMTGLPVTGDLTNDTMNKIFGRRCGRPSNAPLFLAARNRWQQSELTYIIRNTTSQFTTRQIKNIVENSIQQWTNSVNLQITESDSKSFDVDIDIYFTEQDGSGNVLGYAYYPENGDIYFDVDENYSLGHAEESQIYFGWVATHELGHSLGLPHSEFMDSVMFPYYSDTVFKPSERDINSLKFLYGDKSLKFENNVLCDGTHVDAFLESSVPILIKGKQYWTHSEKSLQHGPFSLDDKFPGLPTEIDAAFVVRGANYFFKDDVFYKFKGNNKKFTRKLISAGFDDVLTHPDAAFFDRNEIIYFFKGSKYYGFNINKDPKKRLVIKKDISVDWNGVPDDLEAATMLTDTQVLFVKSGKCYIVDLNSRELLSNKTCSSTFYKCK